MSLSSQIANIAVNKFSLKGVKVASQYLRKEKSVIIVNFHRFFKNNPEFLIKGPTVHTDIEIFEKFLKLLSNRFEFISLSNLLAHLENGTPLKSDSVVITIDDGYEDNVTLALPILNKYSVPATLYVATGFMDNANVLPMDRIEYAIRSTSQMVLEWSFIGSEPISVSTYAEKCRANVVVGKRLKELHPNEMENKIDELYDVLGVSRASDKSGPMLSWEQVKKMSDGGIEIGSHGVSHILMTQLDPDVAVEELHQSKLDIKRHIGVDPIHFAYPNGRAEDFNDFLRVEAKKAGYKTVASTIRSTVRPGISNPLCLPRIGLEGSPQRTSINMEKLLYHSQPFSLA